MIPPQFNNFIVKHFSLLESSLSTLRKFIKVSIFFSILEVTTVSLSTSFLQKKKNLFLPNGTVYIFFLFTVKIQSVELQHQLTLVKVWFHSPFFYPDVDSLPWEPLTSLKLRQLRFKINLTETFLKRKKKKHKQTQNERHTWFQQEGGKE